MKTTIEDTETSGHDEADHPLGLPLEDSTVQRNGATELKHSDVPASSLKPEFAQSSSNGGSKHRDVVERRLEERVQELETKLAVLTRLLQASNGLLSSTREAPLSNHAKQTSGVRVTELFEKNTQIKARCVSPPFRTDSDMIELKTPDTSAPPSPLGSSTVPYLESPAPLVSGKKFVYDTADHTDESSVETNIVSNAAPKDNPQIPRPHSTSRHDRNLSFRLLYEGNEDEYERQRAQNTASTPITTNSMTAFERSWLRPTILHFQQKLRQEQQEHTSSPHVPDDSVRNKWLNYLNSFQESTPDVDVQMEEFIKVPAKVEDIMSYGLFICVDSFLYMITVLPIRFVWSTFLLVLRIIWKQASPQWQFHRQHLYQLIQVMILYTIYRFILAVISIGKFYHWIRGQAMIKLYVLIAIVEVFDRLLGSLGQDCLDSMYWNTVNRPKSWRMIVSVIVVLIYSSLHALILFVHAETLNVAMNSSDQALLTLLISGNFAEIKSTVFKKYNRPALFKITAGDICERFKLLLFLSLVLLLNVCQGMERGQFMEYVRICGIVWCAELLADWIKHAFITKFNFLPARVYPEFALLLAGDVTGIGHEGVNLDHSHAVVKRIGFAQIPLVCVLFRLLREAAKYAMFRPFWSTMSPWMLYTIGAGFWLLLLAVKLALGSVLQRISMAKLRSAPEITQSPTNKKKKQN